MFLAQLVHCFKLSGATHMYLDLSPNSKQWMLAKGRIHKYFALWSLQVSQSWFAFLVRFQSVRGIPALGTYSRQSSVGNILSAADQDNQ